MGNTKKRTKIKDEDNTFSVINLTKLAAAAGVNYHKARFNIVGRYRESSLTDNERTQLANALFTEVRRTFNFLGFEIQPHRRIQMKASSEDDSSTSVSAA